MASVLSKNKKEIRIHNSQYSDYNPSYAIPPSI